MADHARSEFERAAESESSRRGIASEIWDFLSDNKKWWLLPIFVALFLLGILVLLSGSGVAPFIYTLF